MDHGMAQRRMLICAALFSFGTLSGALTVFHLSAQTDERITAAIAYTASFRPMLLIPSLAAFFAFIIMIAGLSIFGCFSIGLMMILLGFVGGALESLSVLQGFHALLNAVFLALFALCYLQIGAHILRRSSLLRRQKTCSGFMQPDDRYDLVGICFVFVLLLLTAFTFAYFTFGP